MPVVKDTQFLSWQFPLNDFCKMNLLVTNLIIFRTCEKHEHFNKIKTIDTEGLTR